MSFEKPGVPLSGSGKPKQPLQEQGEQIASSKPSSEAIQYAFEGLHDYRSNIRLLGMAFSREGAKGLLDFLSETKLETFQEYFRRVSDSNPNLRTKIERDLAAYPGVAAKLEERIKRVNEATTESEVFTAFEDLKKFFGN